MLLALGGLSLLLLVFLTPPFQTPDEQQHLFRAYQLSELDLTPSRVGGEIPTSLGDLSADYLGSRALHPAPPPRAPPLRVTLGELDRPLAAERTTFATFLGTYLPTVYLPQALGVAAGKAAGLGPLGLLYAARAANALAALALVALALRIAPTGREALLAIALLPGSQIVFASASPDAATIAAAIAFAALAFRMARAVRASAGASLALGAALGAVLAGKFVYLPLLVAGAAVVFDGRAGAPAARRRAALVQAIVAATLGVLAVIWFVAAAPAGAAAGTASVGRLDALVSAPLGFFGMLGASLTDQAADIVMSALGVLGWLSLPLPKWAYAASAFAAVASLVAGRKAEGMAPLAGLAWLLLALASVVLIGLALYLQWTAAGAARIGGFQGRYFLPLAPFVALPAVAALSRVGGPKLRDGAYAAQLALLAAGTAAMFATLIGGFGVLR